ncbi:hypothetical protein F2P81_012009 [Scophthalmus maximus]|uniref:Uncharacterized protein n=1 Tax=Scophthalmus maximus TaxID=52904 RepID=A0A6A4STD5_SCOMX|nr:hypothetical protein F2P81_012009 [Scophthalmus maximus]
MNFTAERHGRISPPCLLPVQKFATLLNFHLRRKQQNESRFGFRMLLKRTRLTVMNDGDYGTDCRLASSQDECNQMQGHRVHRGNFTLYKMEAGEGSRTDENPCGEMETLCDVKLPGGAACRKTGKITLLFLRIHENEDHLRTVMTRRAKRKKGIINVETTCDLKSSWCYSTVEENGVNYDYSKV